MFQIDLTSRKPIYEQIMNQFKQLIIKEVLRADEQIPSVRELAKQLTINPNTIQKAYRELERHGYIYSIRGRGNFVSSTIRKVDEEKLDKLKQQVENSLSELIYLGIEKEELIALIEKTYSTIKGGNTND
ncbi:GntR family transcriptional regulator [Lutibacter sp. B2]|nr:GntR family transcriptional regulator [Lutibacter sp. B2]